jgi:hypothetical protein
MKKGDHPVLNECYIPEMGRWMLVDLTNNILAVRNKNGAFLDLVAVRDSVWKKSIFTIYRSESDSISHQDTGSDDQALQEFYSGDYELYYYERVNNAKIYRLNEKIQRYFFAGSWYDIYDVESRSNWLFQLKRILFCCWILSFFVFLITRAKFKI